ncbi:RusA family crossover junction endodeoxyribonuclease [Terrabacter sp. NPDC000476]|uniref:RusA family crossover junction endodeoxyribonuclease n=1 Tax=Terrabacter sp. NPDC000476 TaxID=3154258 RepID=UPI00331D9D5C
MSRATESLDDIERGFGVLLSIAGDATDLHYALIPGAPASKSRPRFGKGGRVYTTTEQRAAEDRTANILRESFPEPFSGNVALACVFYRPDRQRIDADNMLKHVCDAANGVLWHDDSQVTAIVGIVELDADRPRTLITVAPHLTSMTRGTDAHYPCAVCEKPITMAGQGKLRKTCSRDCAAAARGFSLLTEPVPCAQCGQPFKRSTTAQTMCSPECRIESFRKKRKAAAKPFSRCSDCGLPLTHYRGGRCRSCWREHIRSGSTITPVLGGQAVS